MLLIDSLFLFIIFVFINFLLFILFILFFSSRDLYETLFDSYFLSNLFNNMLFI